MTHVSPELMQRFLAGEVDLMLRESVSEHLACCDSCAELLVLLSAEDDALTDALRLDAADQAWVASMDLTVRVMDQVIPWYRRPSLYLPTALVVASAVYVLNWTLSLVTHSLTAEPVGLTVSLLQQLLPALWRMTQYLSQGGLLPSIWPAVVLAAALWLWRSRTIKKEARN
jgi:anti-sigma factor RsiW